MNKKIIAGCVTLGVFSLTAGLTAWTNRGYIKPKAKEFLSRFVEIDQPEQPIELPLTDFQKEMMSRINDTVDELYQQTAETKDPVKKKELDKAILTLSGLRNFFLNEHNTNIFLGKGTRKEVTEETAIRNAQVFFINMTYSLPVPFTGIKTPQVEVHPAQNNSYTLYTEVSTTRSEVEMEYLAQQEKNALDRHGKRQAEAAKTR